MVTVNVKITVSPTEAWVGLPAFDKAGSIMRAAPMLSVSLAVLLPGVGSAVPAGSVTVAVFVTVPVVAVTSAVTVIS